MDPRPVWERRAESFLAFYTATYRAYVREQQVLGRARAGLLVAHPQGGDLPVAASPDLVLVRLRTPRLGVRADIGGGAFRGHMTRDQFVVVPAGAGAAFTVDGPHAIEVLSIPYEPLMRLVGDGHPLPRDGDFGPLHGGFHADPVLIDVWDRLAKEARDGNPHGTLGADGLLLQAAARLDVLRRAPPQATRGALAPWQVRRVVEYLRAHVSEDVDLATLAGIVHLSPYHLVRAFRQATGVPPYRYLLRLRLQLARDLLLQSSLPVGDVAAAVGYDSPQALTRLFRREHGMTPTDFRRIQRR